MNVRVWGWFPIFFGPGNTRGGKGAGLAVLPDPRKGGKTSLVPRTARETVSGLVTNTHEGHRKSFGHFRKSFEHYRKSFEHFRRSFKHYRKSFQHFRRSFEHYRRGFEHFHKSFQHYRRSFDSTGVVTGLA